MKKYFALLLSLLLVGCAVSEEVTQDVTTEGEEIFEAEETITGSFKLTAVQGYVSWNNYEIPHTYIMDTDNNEVYVDIHIEGMTDEERAAYEKMSDEEKWAYHESQPVYEEPRFEAPLLEATKDAIHLNYEEESLVFTSLSDSTYETEDGTRYTIEEDVTIDEYTDSFFE